MKTHMYKRFSMMGLISVRCGRLVKATRFTNDPRKVTCKACLNAMGGGNGTVTGRTTG